MDREPRDGYGLSVLHFLAKPGHRLRRCSFCFIGVGQLKMVSQAGFSAERVPFAEWVSSAG